VSTNLISSGTTAREKVNLRTPDVMAAVQQQVEAHYRSDIVEKVRRAGGIISVGDTTVRLAKQFGFCYGVERAIDLAYAARKVFKDRRLFIVGEIIHNPEVNEQISSLGIKNLTGNNKQADISELGPDDAVGLAAGNAREEILAATRGVRGGPTADEMDGAGLLDLIGQALRLRAVERVGRGEDEDDPASGLGVEGEVQLRRGMAGVPRQQAKCGGPVEAVVVRVVV